MSTYLQLCQDVRRELGISGTGPTAVTGQTGELERIVNWVAQAYTEIQNRNSGHWRWLRREFTVDTVASDDKYSFSDCTDVLASASIDRFSSWRPNDAQDPPRIYLTSSGIGGQRYMVWADLEWFKQIYKIGTQNDGQPHFITIDPQDNILLGPAPNDIYTLTGEYYRSAQVLAADGDIPEMPSQFHQLIVYNAMLKYGYFESAPEVIARAQDEGRRMIRQLENNQMPTFRKAGPLA